MGEKGILLFTLVLCTTSSTSANTGCIPGTNCPPRPLIVVSPVSLRVNYTSPLRMTCVAYLGRESTYQPTTITWFNDVNEQITNSSQVTINSSITIIEGHMFMESALVACTVYSNLIGQASCVVTNVAGEDSATWSTAFDIEPPVVIATTPASQIVEYYSDLQMTCLAVVNAEETNDTDITWWGEFGQIVDTDETLIYTSREWVESILFIESTLVICGVEYENFGRISCIAENSLGRDVVKWNISPPIDHLPPLIILSPVNQNADCRGRVTMTCVVNAYPSADVWWIFNDTYMDNQDVTGFNVISSDETIFGSNFTEAFLEVCNFNDDKVGYYRCMASNIFGNYTSDPVWVGIDPQTAPPVLPPTVTVVERTGNNDAMVEFEPFSLGIFTIVYYIVNDTTTPYLTEMIDSVQTSFQQPRVPLTGLDTCYRYWVVISGSDCSQSGSSEPVLLELYEDNINPYELTVTLGSKDKACDTWITEDPETKTRDMEAGLRVPTSDCGFNIPCFEQSRWECKSEDQMKVTFKTQLVGLSSERADQIKQCIDDWVTAGLAKGQAFAVAGSNLTIFNFTATTAAPSGDAALPTWAWIIIAVGGAILVACLVAVLFSIAICLKRSRSGSAFGKEKLVNEEQDSKSYTEVAVVDNPLYAENEGDVAAYLEEDGKPEEEFEVEAGDQQYDDEQTKSEI